MRGTKSLLPVVVVAAALIVSVPVTHPHAQTGTCEYFATTGHYVCDEFLDFFNTWGGLDIFGYPVTEGYVDPRLGRWVQYFQNSRMEMHPENDDPYKVLLGLLIDEMGYSYPLPSADQIPASNNNIHHYFEETGYVVSYAFLDFFRENGGVRVFGYPRSQFLYENGHIVQYFQRARMEWHPENPPGTQMLLSPIGSMYVDRFGVPSDVIVPIDPEIVASPTMVPPTVTPGPYVTELKISASVRHYVITNEDGSQTLFVYVVDQKGEPVPDALVSMVVHYPSGDQSADFEQPTNESGFTGHHFKILPGLSGHKVVIDVTATYGVLQATTQTFFLPWW
jgi:hypothetical protein